MPAQRQLTRMMIRAEHRGGRRRGWRRLAVGVWAVAWAALAGGCAAESYRDWPARLERPSWEKRLGAIKPRPLRPVEPPAPPAAWTQWMPPVTPGSEFPLLPGDDSTASRSVGGTSHGWLHRGVQPRLPQPHLGFLQTQYGRGYFYGTEELVEMLEAAAADVARRHDGAVTYLGNLSRRGGGDIPYSYSHKSGRDADVAFFMETAEGDRIVPSDYVSLGEDSGDPDEEQAGKHPEVQWDDEVNWTWFRSLLRHGGEDLQYVFLSKPLQRRLLEEARRRGASRELIARAQRVLRQPSGAPPHDDHYHIRTYCSPTSMASGCRETGPMRPWHDPAIQAKVDAVRRAQRATDHDDDSVRRRALQRLSLLDREAAVREAKRRLHDTSPVVRAMAARVYGSAQGGVNALASRLEEEAHPHVVVEVIDALARMEAPKATAVLAGAWERGGRLDSGSIPYDDVRTYIAEALSRRADGAAVPTLLSGLRAEEGSVRWASARALRFVTNHAVAENEVWRHGTPSRRAIAVARWKALYETLGTDRDRWLVVGFRRAGFAVNDLGPGSVWPLCRAILGAEFLSWNAQKALMEIAGRQPRSLRWPKDAANFFWRRWFEKRRDRYGVPPVPSGMSTLDETY